MIIFRRVGWFILIVRLFIDLFFVYYIYRLYKSSAGFGEYLDALAIWAVIRFVICILYRLRAKLYVRLLLKKLGASFFEYGVKIVKDTSTNAFAFQKTPFFRGKIKKYIGITTGMLKRCSKDEVNFAIAHELSHHRNNDIIVSVYTRLADALLKFGFSFIRFFKTSPLLGFLVGLGAMMGLKLILKKQELRADIDAFNYLKDAGLNTEGGLKFFQRILKDADDFEKSIFGKILLLILSDHPFTEKRIKKQQELLRLHESRVGAR